MYETGTSIELHASHSLPIDGPEGQQHAHSYRVDVAVRRSELDPAGFVIDLDLLRDELGVIRSKVDGSDLDRSLSLGLPVTVEVLAAWVHSQLRDLVAASGGGEVSVRVHEGPDGFGGYLGAIEGSRSSSVRNDLQD
jgi:6-pyruvoyl-tetrahydropterin synthase